MKITIEAKQLHTHYSDSEIPDMHHKGFTAAMKDAEVRRFMHTIWLEIVRAQMYDRIGNGD
jgi:hypothetical protein